VYVCIRVCMRVCVCTVANTLHGPLAVCVCACVCVYACVYACVCECVSACVCFACVHIGSRKVCGCAHCTNSADTEGLAVSSASFMRFCGESLP